MNFSRAGALEERQRLALDAVEDIDAQPVHHLVAHPGGQQRLDDAEACENGGDRDHADNVEDEEPLVSGGQCHVDHAAQEEWLGQANQRRQHDGGRQQHELSLVRTEQPEHPAWRDRRFRQLGSISRVDSRRLSRTDLRASAHTADG